AGGGGPPASPRPTRRRRSASLACEIWRPASKVAAHSSSRASPGTGPPEPHRQGRLAWASASPLRTRRPSGVGETSPRGVRRTPHRRTAIVIGENREEVPRSGLLRTGEGEKP